MRISSTLFLLFAAAGAHAHPVDHDEGHVEEDAIPAAVADASIPIITAPPEQIDIELEKRQDDSDNSTSVVDEEEEEEEDVTTTTTITVVETISDFVTVTDETTTTSTITGTSTVFTTVTETMSDVDTATLTEYETISVANEKRSLPTPTSHARDIDDYHMQPRAVVYLVKRATVVVTATETEETTVEGTTTITNNVVVKTTVYTTVESTITTTTYEDAETTVTTTSTIVVTTLTEDANPTVTEAATDTMETASIQTTDSDGSDSDSSGLSSGAQIGIGVGAGAVGLFLIAALVYWFVKKRKNDPEPEWYDPHNDLNNRPGALDPTVPSISPGPGAEMAETGSGGGYRGAPGPGTHALAGAGGAAAVGAGAAGAIHNDSKSWAASSGNPNVSPPSRYASPSEASPYSAGAGKTPVGGYAAVPQDPINSPVNEMDGGWVHHAVEADSRPVVVEAPDRNYT